MKASKSPSVLSPPPQEHDAASQSNESKFTKAFQFSPNITKVSVTSRLMEFGIIGHYQLHAVLCVTDVVSTLRLSAILSGLYRWRHWTSCFGSGSLSASALA